MWKQQNYNHTRKNIELFYNRINMSQNKSDTILIYWFYKIEKV